MTEESKKPEKSSGGQQEFQERIAVKQRRRLHSLQQEGYRAWFGLGMFGMVGWSVVVPTVLCIALGIWLDSTVTGRYSWTLLLLGVGVTIGCFNAWFWVSKERAAIERERRERGKEDSP